MALSADRILTERNSRGRCLDSHVVKTGSTVYKGSLIVLGSAGKILVAANAGTTTRFLGVAVAGAVAGATCEYVYGTEMLLPIASGTTVGYVGRAVYCADDQTVGIATTLGPIAGTLRKVVTTTTGWVAVGVAPVALVANNT